MISQGIFPYAGTSGWAGSQTSFERAVNDDTSGVTNKRQKDAIAELKYAHFVGLTWKELAESLKLHHGQASGVLSVLHKSGQIARLKLRRNKCAIYVMPEFVDGREVEPHGNTKASADQNKLTDIERYIEFLNFERSIPTHVYKAIKEMINRND